MSEAEDLLLDELRRLPSKPPDYARQADKKRFSELMSAAAARALSEALRRKGLNGTLPLASEPLPPPISFESDSEERQG